MVEIQFDFSASGDDPDDEPYLDDYEIHLMFEHTRAQITRHVERALGGLRCEEHGGAPRVKITGLYSRESEQMDIQYHIDGCCNRFILKAIQALNH